MKGFGFAYRILQRVFDRFSFSQKSGKKKIIGIAVILILFASMIFLGELKSDPKNIYITNLTDKSATVSWVTQKPTKGTIIISQDGKFPLLPLFSSQIIKDDGDKNRSKAGIYKTHYVSVTDLSANAEYSFRIYQGWRVVWQGKFKTPDALNNIANPSPVYGRIANRSGNPIVGAIVYFRLKNSVGESSILSAITNLQGRWSVDMGNTRSGDLKTPFQFSKDTVEEVGVETGREKVKAKTDLKNDQPWPDIIIP